jgi:hypothetical protein
LFSRLEPITHKATALPLSKAALQICNTIIRRNLLDGAQRAMLAVALTSFQCVMSIINGRITEWKRSGIHIWTEAENMIQATYLKRHQIRLLVYYQWIPRRLFAARKFSIIYTANKS